MLSRQEIATWVTAEGRKLRLKQIRAYATIAKSREKSLDELFVLANSLHPPSATLFAANVGASCGVRQAQALEVFSRFGEVSHLEMHSLCAYAIVSLADQKYTSRKGLVEPVSRSYSAS